jgi:predicted dithiol-disulfide oxidoreductase (DUF899 family)
MTEHKVGTREEWLAARTALLAEEKELTRRSDELARKQQALPRVPLENDYSFETDDGRKRLADLFGGRSQLLAYHFIFGPTVEGWADAGCPGCSYTADSLDGAVAEIDLRRDELHGLSAFALEDGVVYHTYSCYDRGTDVLNVTWQLLDRTAKGRGDDPEGWPRRHEEYPND